MGIKDWWVENLAGKVDPSPIYGELSLKEKRNPRKREAYIARRLAEAEADASAHRRSREFHTPDTACLKRRIYSSDYILSGRYDAGEEKAVIEAAFSELLDSPSKVPPDWAAAVARFRDEPGMQFYFPTLFADDVGISWEDYVNAVTVKREKEASEARAEASRKAMEARRKAEEEAVIQRAAKERRDALESRISDLKSEISRLNSLFYNETEYMERVRLMYAVESREKAVKHLQEQL